MDQETKVFKHRFGHYPRLTITFTGPGRTKQSFKDECDINNLMAKYLRTGRMEHVNEALPRFECVSGHDFQSAQNLIANAASMFEDIPSTIRNRFDNNPGKLLDWVHDPKNAQEAHSLGFLDVEKLSEGSPYRQWQKTPPAGSEKPAGGETGNPTKS